MVSRSLTQYFAYAAAKTSLGPPGYCTRMRYFASPLVRTLAWVSFSPGVNIFLYVCGGLVLTLLHPRAPSHALPRVGNEARNRGAAPWRDRASRTILGSYLYPLNEGPAYTYISVLVCPAG